MRIEPRDRLAPFERAFGYGPQAVWSSPGRVNLLGEHTDYNDGLCLPMALGFGVDCAAGMNGSGLLRVVSAQRPGEVVTQPLSELRADGWSSYAVGAVWALQSRGLEIRGLDLALDSDLPEGAGLSSSAALECAVIAAAADLHEVTLEKVELARTAQHAENAFVGVPCGLMDQMASACGERGHALLFDARSGQARQVPFATELLVLDTRAPHRLVDGTYAERRRECERAASVLGSLREATTWDLPDPALRKRARHVITEIARVAEAVALLDQGDVEALGPLMTASHASLRDDFEVTVPELDVAVSVALRHGARGARMTGAGFGGSIVALTHDARGTAEAVTAEFAERGWNEPRWFVTGAHPGTHQVG